MRLGILVDVDNVTVCRKENDVERDIGVFHPDGQDATLAINEQHARRFGHLTHEHQASPMLLGRQCNVDVEQVTGVPACGDDDGRRVECLVEGFFEIVFAGLRR